MQARPGHVGRRGKGKDANEEKARYVFGSFGPQLFIFFYLSLDHLSRESLRKYRRHYSALAFDCSRRRATSAVRSSNSPEETRIQKARRGKEGDLANVNWSVRPRCFFSRKQVSRDCTLMPERTRKTK
ncbi:diuretic hormone class 2 isoform X3 [Calliopsis andreniformis]|uniref:diuretic hormone class 2 isoform X3 n=1 Tax=Calliopsis andreniformis TaxID=337506 RepID=UPI003FCDC01B